MLLSQDKKRIDALTSMSFGQDAYFFGDVLDLIRVCSFIRKLSVDSKRTNQNFPGVYTLFSWNELFSANPEQLAEIMHYTTINGNNLCSYLRKTVQFPGYPDFFPKHIAISDEKLLYTLVHTFDGITDHEEWMKRMNLELSRRMHQHSQANGVTNLSN